MIPQAEVSRYLSELSSRREDVARRLEVGDPIQRNLGSYYLIDDLSVVKVLGEVKPGTIPYDAVRRTLRSSWREIHEVFCYQGKRIPEGAVLDFSTIVEARLGECVEKAALLQLAIQDSMESYFVMGLLKEDGELCFDGHTFNIAPVEGRLHVIDAENPVVDEEDKEHPYAAVILEINDESGEIVVPEKAVFGRRYYI